MSKSNSETNESGMFGFVNRILVFLGAFAIFYTVVQAINQQPFIAFDAKTEDIQLMNGSIEKHFVGIIKNRSLAPNSIVEFSLSVFEVKTKSRVHDEYMNGKIYRNVPNASY